MTVFDVAVVGGGINGCGIARDAAGRGHSVFLCEMGDLASGTSSMSSKLVHGGLRYLEFYEFRLVREALTEREVLWRLAPHLVRPMRFVLPHHAGLRPAWLLRFGLFLYDHIGGRKRLPPTRIRNLAREDVGVPLKHGRFNRGFEYSDCFVDDARLVVLNACDARAHGAMVRTRCRAVALSPDNGGWRITLEDAATGTRSTVAARIVVNAAGPWVEDLLSRGSGVRAKAHVRLVQGSHIVVPRLYAHDRAYTFQNADGRIVFVIPYQDDFTLIGTTDRDYEGDPGKVEATREEISYLCRSASDYLAKPVKPADVVWSYAGVRPLYDDGVSEARAATRDYVLELNVVSGAPLLSIFGGKITTYRRLAEAVLARLAPYLHGERRAAGWTAQAPLPGGDFDADDFSALIDGLARDYPFLAPAHLSRIAHAYGTRARDWLGAARSLNDLGQDFGATLTAAEVAYLIENEWAVSADDVIWRRSKLGLRLTAAQIATLEAWMATHMVSVASPPA